MCMLSEDKNSSKKLRGKWKKQEIVIISETKERGIFSSFRRSQRRAKMSNAAEKRLQDLEIRSISCADRKGDRY